jgi:hypothetical protein
LRSAGPQWESAISIFEYITVATSLVLSLGLVRLLEGSLSEIVPGDQALNLDGQQCLKPMAIGLRNRINIFEAAEVESRYVRILNHMTDMIRMYLRGCGSCRRPD